VTDSLGSSDSLFPAITVVPENKYACSLSVSCADTAVHIDYASRTVSLTGDADTLTLLFTIHDGDHPATERYRVTWTKGNVTQEFEPSGRSFAIAVLPEPGAPADTMTVALSDSTATTFTLPLYFNHPRPAPGEAGVRAQAAEAPSRAQDVFYPGRIRGNE
jgi:hypothetical protein